MEDIAFFHDLTTYKTSYTQLEETEYLNFVKKIPTMTPIKTFLTKYDLIDLKKIIDSIRLYHVPAFSFSKMELTGTREDLEERIISYYNSGQYIMVPLNSYNELLSNFNKYEKDEDLIAYLKTFDIEKLKTIMGDIRVFYLPKNQCMFDTALNKNSIEIIKNIVNFYRNHQLPQEMQISLKQKYKDTYKTSINDF